MSVIAYSSTAVPATVGDAGVVLPGKEPARVAHFGLARSRDRWVELLRGLPVP